MERSPGTRRDFLRGAGGTVGAAWIAALWPSNLLAQGHAHRFEGPSTAPGTPEFLTVAEAADVEAIAAQIVPTDDTPGAREAGVLAFIDRSLRTWAAPGATRFRDELHAFQSAFAAAHGGSAFASADAASQVAFLKTVERDGFFASMRVLTLLGMFSHPSYGGNRDRVGWRLIGFEDRHGFAPPFGWYDRESRDSSPEPRP